MEGAQIFSILECSTRKGEKFWVPGSRVPTVPKRSNPRFRVPSSQFSSSQFPVPTTYSMWFPVFRFSKDTQRDTQHTPHTHTQHTPHTSNTHTHSHTHARNTHKKVQTFKGRARTGHGTRGHGNATQQQHPHPRTHAPTHQRTPRAQASERGETRVIPTPDCPTVPRATVPVPTRWRTREPTNAKGVTPSIQVPRLYVVFQLQSSSQTTCSSCRRRHPFPDTPKGRPTAVHQLDHPRGAL